MPSVRRIDPAGFDRSRYDIQPLWHGESCAILASNVPAGQPAYRRHRHEHSDQLYYVIEGRMQAQLGTEQVTAGPDTLVYIPRGMPHHNRNEGDVDELHLEVMAPCPFPTLPLATPTGDLDSGDLSSEGADSGGADSGVPFLVSPLDPSGFTPSEKFPGFSVNQNLFPAGRSEHVAMYVGEVEPGAAGPPMHVHPFDQFYFVLAGELSVQIGFERHVAGPGTLAAMPAGVPHRQWNEGPLTERHLTLLVPSPRPGVAMDVGVVFEPSGVEID